MLAKIKHSLTKAAEEFSHDKIRLYAAQSAFFIITSIFPFLVIVLSIISITDYFSEQMLVSIINDTMPKRIASMLTDYIYDFYSTQNITIFVINIISGLWISSIAFQSFKEGFDHINKIPPKHNFLINRLIGGIFSIIFTITIILMLVLYIFGSRLADFLQSSFPWSSSIIRTLFNNRNIIFFLAFSLFFAVFFRIMQGKKGSIVRELPGAFLSSLGLILFSAIYSKSIDYSMNFSIIYGSITNIAFAMLWLYFSIYIIYLGAEFNKLLRYLFSQRKKSQNAVSYDSDA